MKTVGKIILRTIITLIVLVLVLVGVIFGLRWYNGSKYTITQAAANARNDSQYQTTDEIVRIREGAVIGYRFTPRMRLHPGTVVVYGGSEGSPNYRQAKAIHEQGYEVLALYFWGQEGQQPSLANVPLDQFTEVEKYIEAHVDHPRPITVIGSSKGAEFAAELAAHGFGVDNLVNFAPADHAYGGLVYDYQAFHPSFTYQGSPVPFASFEKLEPADSSEVMWAMLTNYPPSYRKMYEVAAKNAAADSKIDLTSFKGHALFFAGDKDAMWPGDVAAKTLAAQSDSFEAHVFPNAGHIFSEDLDKLGTGWEISFGGTAEGGATAFAESNRILYERLATWHGSM
ncbi:hypothetical protein I6B53_04725 [Schaalia sp. 19OD2882]|uniref:acyl-CoA thioester hydrolase/BAAT C-terminal domain-containing protein n=1 Tax=Schaalia sp. 19OD2882 TaxID=2794089 RepID=UPI001C1F1827|nr:acyl-CoA thioester hydrolase/BAAT C-terminal domain-containing protein [Schaalia sp. 19OD2882]QWW20388.1 hypothetical protein I6B53_04725 [Schaalia sp. 19OD2882]